MLNGADQMIARISAIAAKQPQRAAAALYQEALLVEGTSKSLTPVDFGILRDSHETKQPQVEGNNISVAIVVGGAAEAYAVEVHENLNSYHRVGQAKFLEGALYAHKPDLMANLSQRLRLDGGD
jgi:hypothetical protein